MNLLLTLISLMTVSSAAFATPLLERQLFNSRNGENFRCVIHENGKVEISSDNGPIQKTKSISLQPDAKKIADWIKATKKSTDYKKVVDGKRGIETLEPEKTTQYVLRGSKTYLFRDGAKMIPFYKMKGFIPATRNGQASNEKPGSYHYKLLNYQQLKGATDLACKMAL